jgi:predicted deacylase
VIGYSVEGRPLEVFTFGAGVDQRMIVAGIHGGYEWNTVALADELIAWLRFHPEAVPSGVTLHILRALNPDGLARGVGYEGRANGNAVDLNRNWPAHWNPDWPKGGCWDFMPITAGSSAGSEPETQALLSFLRGRRLTTLISYHSAALGIFPGGRPLHLPSVQLAQALAQVSAYPYPPVETGCLLTGNLVDWTAEHGIASVDLELHTHHTTDFQENLRVLEVFLTWRPEVGVR